MELDFRRYFKNIFKLEKFRNKNMKNMNLLEVPRAYESFKIARLETSERYFSSTKTKVPYLTSSLDVP